MQTPMASASSLCDTVDLLQLGWRFRPDANAHFYCYESYDIRSEMN